MVVEGGFENEAEAVGVGLCGNLHCVELECGACPCEWEEETGGDLFWADLEPDGTTVWSREGM